MKVFNYYKNTEFCDLHFTFVTGLHIMYIFESYLWQTVGIHLATLVPVTMIIPVQS